MNKFYLALGLGFLFSSQIIAQSVGYIQNKGQWSDDVVAKYALANGVVWFKEDRVVIPIIEEETFVEAVELAHEYEGDESILVDGHAYSMRFGSDANTSVDFSGKHSDYVNYFIGNNRSKWASKVGVYDMCSYDGIKPGVDLNWTIENGNVKYTYQLSQGVDPDDVYMEYSAIRSLAVIDENLIIELPNLEVKEQKPFAYQIIDDEVQEVSCGFNVKGNKVFFDVGEYNTALPLFIDPVVVASTNIGATVSTYGHSATFDQFGNIYGGGRPFGSGYPTDTGSFQIDFAGGGVDIGLSKLNEDGSDLLWSTYIGGSNQEFVHSIVVNGFNDVIVYGKTNSIDYPVSETAVDTTYNGGWDICVTVLSDSGDVLVGSTYLGGEGDDGNNVIPASYSNFKGEVVCDLYSNVYVASTSSSDSFLITQNAFQTQRDSSQDGTVTKLNYNLSQLIFSTYLGTSANDAAFNLKPAKDNSVYVVGATGGDDFPTSTGSHDETWNFGQYDAFITRLAPDGESILQSTYVQSDSNGNDKGFFLQIDRSGDVYILGTSDSIQADTNKYAGPGSGSFIRKYTKELDSLYWTSTFTSLSHSAFLVDNCKNIYAAGNGPGLVDTIDAVQATQGGFYLMALSPDADTIVFGSYYGSGGSHVDGGTSRFDKRGAVYQATCTGGFFPTNNNAYSTNQNGTWDLTLFKIDFEIQAAVANAQVAPNSTGCVPFTVDFTNFGSAGLSHFWDFGDGDTANTQTPTHTFDEPGIYEVSYVIFDTVGCVLSDTSSLVLVVYDTTEINILSDSIICINEVELYTDSPFAQYTWSTGQTSETIAVDQSGEYWVEIENACGVFTDTIEIEIIPPYEFQLPADTGICQPGFIVNGPLNGVSFQWNTGDTTQFISIDSAGKYVLTASNEFCSAVDTIIVVTSYTNFSSGDTVICDSVYTITVANQGGSTLWSTGDTLNAITLTESGQYWVVLNNGFCSTTDSLDLTLGSARVDAGPDTVICEQTEISAFDSDLISYVWSTGDSSASIMVDSSGLYWVIVENEFCSGTDSIDIELQQFSFESTEYLFCDEDSGLIDAPGDESFTFLWNTSDTTKTITVKDEGLYYVNVSTPFCSQSDSVQVRFGSSPNFSLGGNQVICNGQTTKIEVDSLWSSVRWSTGDTSSLIIVNDSGIVSASMFFQGCEKTEEIRVSFQRLNFDSLILVPNVITPNGDGINDDLGLKIADPSLITDYHLYVYNRWGALLFSSEYINHNWDGRTPAGDPVEKGTYFYLFEGKTVCTDVPVVEVKDNVTVLR